MSPPGDDNELDIPPQGLARMLSADMEMTRLFIDEPLVRQYRCCRGLSIWLTEYEGQHYLDISLNHLSKETITDLFQRGELIDEMLFLYELAHLPFADAYIMKMSDSAMTHIVDRVRIHLDRAFNVVDEKEWAKHETESAEQAMSLASLYQYDAVYAGLNEAKAKRNEKLQGG